MAEAVASIPTIRSLPSEVPRSAEVKEQSGPDERYSERIESQQAWLEAAAERIKQVVWLKLEQWKDLNVHEKVVALNAAGRALAEVFQIPSPPLIVLEMDEPGAYGSYGDGYRFNIDTGQIEGSDYAIKMNLAGSVDYEKLFGDDPAVALETYAHEFRHSYQAEQIVRYQRPQHRHLVDDPNAVQAWLRPYITPDEDYEAYRNQPVEKDAREFAEALIQTVYS